MNDERGCLLPYSALRTQDSGLSTLMSFIRALIVLHRAYRHRGARTRLHILIRFLTCPFLRVPAAVPRAARSRDIGAGHGLFACPVAARGAKRVVAVEPDVR